MATVPHMAALGIVYRGHGAGWAELALPWNAQLIGFPDFGIVANGAVFSLVDSTAGFAVFTATGKLDHATLDLRLDYLGAPAPGTEIVARIESYRSTRRVVFVRGTAHTGDPARPIASATGTFMLADAA